MICQQVQTYIIIYVGVDYTQTVLVKHLEFPTMKNQNSFPKIPIKEQYVRVSLTQYMETWNSTQYVSQTQYILMIVEWSEFEN